MRWQLRNEPVGKLDQLLIERKTKEWSVAHQKMHRVVELIRNGCWASRLRYPRAMYAHDTSDRSSKRAPATAQHSPVIIHR